MKLKEVLQSTTYTAIGPTWKSLFSATPDGAKKDTLRWLARNDRYFLLVELLGRKDAIHPFIYYRCREVENDTDDNLDLWARNHYKLLADDTPVNTPEGYVKHGDIRPGDKVFSPEGKPVRVLAVTDTLFDPSMYSVHLRNKIGTIQQELKAGADHLWDVEYYDRRRLKGKTDRVGWVSKRLSTFELINHTIRQQKVKNPRRYRIPFASATQGKVVDHIVHPYTLGCWLGDGSDGNLTNENQELWHNLEACGEEVAGVLSVEGGLKKTRTVYGLITRLKSLGLGHMKAADKGIPEQYFKGSEEQRRSLLYGLMDTDGNVTPSGTYLFTTTSSRLGADLVKLLLTLGVVAQCNTVDTTYKEIPYTVYQVQFSGVIPFSIRRHLKKIRKTPVKQYWYIYDIKPTKTVASQCIQVEGGRYIAGDKNIPTHNSTIITFAGVIQEILKDPEITVGIFSHTRPIAKSFLRQIKREFENNGKLKKLFPDILWRNPRSEAPVWSEDSGIVVKRKTNPKESTVSAWGLVDGTPTSAHYGLLVYDDVVTAASVATSEMIQKTTEGWELSLNLASRPARMQYIGTRYSYADTYAVMMARGAVTPRVYPATKDGTFDGDPVMLTSEELATKRKQMGESTFGAQMLQNPLAGADATFRIEWIQRWQTRPLFINAYILVDPAMSKKKNSDRTAMVVVGLDGGGNKYLLDGFLHRMDLRERWKSLLMLQRKWKRAEGVLTLKVGYERFGGQADVEYFKEQMDLGNDYFPIEELSWPREGGSSKIDRIQRLTPDFESGRMYFPWGGMETRRMREAPVGLRAKKIVRVDENVKPYDLSKRLEEEMLLFPVGRRDDGLDALSRLYDIGMRRPSPPAVYGTGGEYEEIADY